MPPDRHDPARDPRATSTEPGDRPADAPSDSSAASAASAGLGRVMAVRGGAERSRAGEETDLPSSPARSPTPRKHRLPPCPGCGYDLTGTQNAGLTTCPECGLMLEASVLQTMREQKFFRRFGWTVALSVIGLLITVVIIGIYAGGRALFIIPLILILFAWAPFLLIARLTRDME